MRRNLNKILNSSRPEGRDEERLSESMKLYAISKIRSS